MGSTHGGAPKHLAFCKGIITVALVIYVLPGSKQRQDTLGDLIRLAVPYRLTAALTHSTLFLSANKPYCKGEEGFGMLTLVSSAGRFLL